MQQRVDFGQQLVQAAFLPHREMIEHEMVCEASKCNECQILSKGSFNVKSKFNGKE